MTDEGRNNVGVAAVRRSENQQREVVDLTGDSDEDIYNVPVRQKKKRKHIRYKLRDDSKNQDSPKGAMIEMPTKPSSSTIDTNATPAEPPPINVTKLGEENSLCPKEDMINNDLNVAESTCSRFSTTDDNNESNSSDSDEDLDKKPAAKDGLSAYELLRQERIKRNIAKLVGAWINTGTI